MAHTVLRIAGWIMALAGIAIGALGLLSFMHGGFLILLWALPLLAGGIVMDKAGRSIGKSPESKL